MHKREHYGEDYFNSQAREYQEQLQQEGYKQAAEHLGIPTLPPEIQSAIEEEIVELAWIDSRPNQVDTKERDELNASLHNKLDRFSKQLEEMIRDRVQELSFQLSITKDSIAELVQNSIPANTDPDSLAEFTSNVESLLAMARTLQYVEPNRKQLEKELEELQLWLDKDAQEA